MIAEPRSPLAASAELADELDDELELEEEDDELEVEAEGVAEPGVFILDFTQGWLSTCDHRS